MKDIKTLSNDDRYVIADRIVSLRKESGYKSKDIAQQMEISASAYSDIECANTKLSLDNLYKLCQIFDVSADYIIFGETEGAYVAEIRKLLRCQRPKIIEKIIGVIRIMVS